MARKRQRTRPNRYPPEFIAAVVIIFAFIVLAVASSVSRRALTRLPIPKASPSLSYSGPLTLKHSSVSVLGAQTIDPLDFIDGINRARADVGSPPLRLSTTLMKAAKLRADVILRHQNFSHQDPYEGIELGTVLPKLKYHFTYASENIGMGGLSAADFVTGFMNSTTHRRNLLDPTLTETGAAVTDGPYQKWYVNIAVQLFAIPGGKDEYRGYTDAERQMYETSLGTISSRLNPLVRLVNKMLNTPGYSDASLTKLTRQKNLLEPIVEKMRVDERLESSDVAQILEYNSLL